MTSLYDINVMTLYEFEARMYAYRLKEVDKQEEMHWRAWLNNRVQATTEKGKPIYKTFKDFFDHEKEVRKIKQRTNSLDKKSKKLVSIARKVNERR